MSLISGANFVAPLRSKVQIVGIFALAVLVAVLRLAGSASTNDDDAAKGASEGFRATSSRESSLAGDVDSYLAGRRKGKAREVQPEESGDVTVDKLLSGEGSQPSARLAPLNESDERAAEPEKLNDIKRSLGIE